MGPYGDYHLEEGWPPKNFYSYNHHPRYLVNMMGLRNRIGILSEAFAHERFYQRIHSTYSFMTEILEYAYHHASEIRNIIKQAEDSTKYKVTKSAGDIQKGMVYKMMPLHPLNNFISYDYAPFVDSLGTPKYYRTGKIVRFDKVMYHAKYEATKETTVPSGYIVPHEFGYIIDNLKLHGVTVQTLDKNKEYVGEQFVVDSLQHDAQMFQKHFSATAYGQYLNKHIKFKKGDYIISMNQPLSNLIFYLLEPESDDGLVHWNFFDSYFEKLKAEKKPLISPVFKYYER
jgi:hypothetical protein